MNKINLPCFPISIKDKKRLKNNYTILLSAEEAVDRKMISESISNYLLPEVDYKNKVCLDLGANIGAFTRLAYDSEAKKICAVECDLRNFYKLQESFK